MALTRFARVLKNKPIEFLVHRSNYRCIGGMPGEPIECRVYWGNAWSIGGISSALGESLANRANAIRPYGIFRFRSQLIRT